MTRQDIAEIWAEVKANKAILDACPLHSFERIAPEMGSDYRCTNCGGTVQSTHASWYEIGLTHGGSKAQADRHDDTET